jgi:hypothetical protein
MKKTFILLILILFGLSVVQAQDLVVSGIIVDSSSTAYLSGANIVLTQKRDATLQYYGTSNQKGNFRLRKVKPGKYRIEVSYVGYQTFKDDITIHDKNVYLGRIMLTPEVVVLSEVEVTDLAIAVEQKGDTTQYNAASYKAKPDATAENILEKMPGMVVKDGKMQAQGEDVKKVLVDGRPFFGDDPNAALKNIPAEIISKIEVFDQQSEQSRFTGFDDGNSVKTINIITKKEFRNGTFGNGYLGYGYDNKYSLGGAINSFNDDRRITVLVQSNNINRQNFSTEDLAGVVSSSSGSKGGRRGGGPGGGQGRPGGGVSVGGDINDFLVGEQDGIISTNAFGLNYTDKFGKKLNLTASYFFNQSENESKEILRQRFFSSEYDGQEYYEADKSKSKNINHRFNLRLDYEINRNNSILFMPKLTLQKNDGFSDLLGQTTLGDSTLNKTINNYYSDVNGYSFSNFILWRHKFEKRGRTFSVNFTQEIKSNFAESYLNALNIYYTSMQFDTVDQNANLDQYEQLYSGRFTYTEPIGRGAMLMFNYISTYNKNNSDKKTYNYDPGQQNYSSLDTALTNVTDNHYTTHKLGVGIQMRKRKSVFMATGFFEMADLSINQVMPSDSDIGNTYKNILPMAMWRYMFSRNKNLRIFYRANTSPPSVEQLQEVVDNSNSLQLKIGNSNLDQEYYHNIFIKYSATNPDKNTVFFAMLRGSFVNSYIAKNTTIAYKPVTTPEGIYLESGSQLTRLENLDGYYNIKSFLTFGRPVKKLRTNVNLNVSADFSRIPGIINDELNTVNVPSLGLGVVLSSNISEKIDFTVNSTSSINITVNSLNTIQNSNYFNQTSSVKLYYNFFKSVTFRTELLHQYYIEYNDNVSTDYLLWNMSLGTRLFENKRGEILVTVHDVLNQNKTINRISTETYVQDSESKSLGTYLMLTFKYSFAKILVKN